MQNIRAVCMGVYERWKSLRKDQSRSSQFKFPDFHVV
jgi:hypothetical protein